MLKKLIVLSLVLFLSNQLQASEKPNEPDIFVRSYQGSNHIGKNTSLSQAVVHLNGLWPARLQFDDWEITIEQEGKRVWNKDLQTYETIVPSRLPDQAADQALIGILEKAIIAVKKIKVKEISQKIQTIENNISDIGNKVDKLNSDTASSISELNKKKDAENSELLKLKEQYSQKQKELSVQDKKSNTDDMNTDDKKQ